MPWLYPQVFYIRNPRRAFCLYATLITVDLFNRNRPQHFHLLHLPLSGLLHRKWHLCIFLLCSIHLPAFFNSAPCWSANRFASFEVNAFAIQYFPAFFDFIYQLYHTSTSLSCKSHHQGCSI